MKPLRRITALLALILLAAALAPPAAAATPQAPPSAEKVNINSASADQLTALPGIGPSYAQRIVEYREKNGPFKRVEDILNVRGIGEKTFERIRERITIGAAVK
ncbi:MAG TPA: helix-hairpin-helix domain-containing protein [Candidatus Polarisedimenticolia bacterium]|jgi:competence ComEA-like helix-hairpin-helix protein|nr:helix-hairpin-helix domain-containing protein [Candidatus Polarisedimenticolia bacterium]